MPGFVVGHALLLIFVNHALFLFQSRRHSLHTLVELLHAHGRLVFPGRQQGRFVDEVGEVGSGEARRLPGESLEIDTLIERLAFGVDLEDRFPALEIGTIHHYLAVEPAGAQQRGIEHIRAIGGRQDDDMGVSAKTVHFDQDLVESLFPLIV